MDGWAELRRIVADVCDDCLLGLPSECHTPGCAFWLCPSIDAEQGEALRRQTEVLNPTEDPTERRPVGLPVTCDPASVPVEIVEAAAEAVARHFHAAEPVDTDDREVAGVVLAVAAPLIRGQLVAELRRTEGDLAVAIREASTAREALRQLRPLVPSRPSLRRLIDTGLGVS